VPSVTLILRKAFGGAFIAMNSKALGADYAFAWPNVELGVMSAEQAVGILNRREIAAAEDPATRRRRLASDYSSQHLHVERAAADGFVDEVISPASTRACVASCLAALAGAHRAPARGSNIPL
jgi:acetyl-CoA carboxylase carboxyltransferase component